MGAQDQILLSDMDVLDYGKFVLSRFRSVFYTFSLNERMLSDPPLSPAMGSEFLDNLVIERKKRFL